MKKFLTVAAALLLVPLSAFAASVTITAPYPAATVNADTRVSFTVVPSGFTHPTYWLVDSFPGGATSGNIDASGNFFWTPNQSEVGMHTLTITVSDQSASAQATQTIVVNGGAMASVVQAAPNTASIGSLVTFTLSTSGLIGAVTYTASDSFAGSSMRPSVVDSNGMFSWIPIAQDIGTHTIRVVAKDSLGYTASTSQTIVVLPPQALTLTKPSPGYTVPAGQIATLVATTSGFITPVYSVVDSNGSTTATVSASGLFSWTPQSNDIGGHTFTITATDGTHRLSSTFQLWVTAGTGEGAVTPIATTTSTSTTSTQAGAQATTHASAYTFTKTLGIGSRGADVTALQTILIAHGYLSGTPTGYFGALTRAALMQYQTVHGLSAVGSVGPMTRAALNQEK